MTDVDGESSAVTRWAGTLSEAGLGGAASLVGFLIGGPVGALVGGVSPPVGSAILKAVVARAARSNEVVAIAARESSVDVDVFLDRLAGDPKRQELLLRVLEAAGAGAMSAKVTALGKVLAVGLGDTKVDEAYILVGALADIDAPHVQVLNLLGGPPPDADADESGGSAGWVPDRILGELPGHSLVLPAIVQTLLRHGLIREPPASAWIDSDEAPLSITALGRVCLDLLTDLGTSGPSEP